jgi:hypothetical protein
MNKSSFAIVLLASLTMQISHATLPATTTSSAKNNSALDVIERGGTIDSMDAKKHTLTVDGAPYLIPVGSVRIHTRLSKVTGSLLELRPGMQIRFSSIKDQASGNIQMREIWVTR